MHELEPRIACLAVVGILAGGAGAYAATGGLEDEAAREVEEHTMNGKKSSANCPNSG